MSIEKLKALAAKRSKTPWEIVPIDPDIPEDGVFVRGQPSNSWPHGYPIAEQTDDVNAEFIAMASNCFDEMLAVVEAAETSGLHHNHNKFDCDTCKAIQALHTKIKTELGNE